MRRSPRTAVAATSLVATAAFLAVGIPVTTATANPAPHTSTLRAGAMEARLTPAQRTALIKSADGETDATARQLGLGAKEKLVVKDVVKDADGTLHTRYERTYAGLPVLGGDLVVHSPAKGTGTLSTTFNTDKRITVPSTTPKVAGSAATASALKTARALDTAAPAAKDARTVVWAGRGEPRLAWETVVNGVQADGTPSRLHVITDAATGEELSRYEDVKTGTGNTQYSGRVPLSTTLSGSTYQLTDTTRGGHRTYNLNHATSGTGTLFTDADDIWGDGTGAGVQTAAADAAYGAQETWDFYKDTFGRSGIRNDGVGATSRVHYGTNYGNAGWDDSCFCMIYGDGAGGTHPLTALDVAGHEMSHGVTSATANLVYSGESGGLNEATSDIFAAGVEFFSDTSTDPGDYLVGEKIDINGNGTPLRYMDEPSKDGLSADYWYSGLGNLNVHYSSGPANHMFYLLAEGSGSKVVNGVSYNSPTSDGLPVTGIGRAAALQIWYKALTTYMTSSTNYAGARTAALSAASSLYGSSSAQYAGVQNAFAAIGVGSRAPVQGVTVTNPGNRSSVTGTAVSLQIQAGSTNSGALSYAATGLPAGLAINSATGLISGTPTTAGTYSTTVTVTDSAARTGTASFTWTVTAPGSCGTTQLLGNPGFESGSASWTASSGVITNSSSQAAHGGSYKAWLNGYAATHTDTLSQSVSVPAGCKATFTFWLHIDSAETTTSTQYDKLTVTAGSTTLATYSNLNKASGYTQKSFSLNAFAGSTVTLKFTGTEDSSLQTSFVVDDTAVNTGN